MTHQGMVFTVKRHATTWWKNKILKTQQEKAINQVSSYFFLRHFE